MDRRDVMLKLTGALAAVAILQSAPASAQLARGQVLWHWGHMLLLMFETPAAMRFWQEGDWSIGEWARMAHRYVTNGTSGTQAERREAMRAFLREWYLAWRGIDPDIDPHTFRQHWLRQEIAGSEGDY